MTPFAIIEEGWVTTIFHIERIVEIIAVIPIEYLITVLEIWSIETIYTIFTSPEIAWIEAILTFSGIEDKITIFEITTIIRVLRILHCLRYCFSWHWYNFLELIPLLKKWAWKIKISSILLCIPSIGVPIVTLIDWTRCIGWEKRNNTLSCRITDSLVDIFLIPPGITPYSSTLWTVCRKGKWYFFACKSRCESLEKISINIRNIKGGRTMRAETRFDSLFDSIDHEQL